MLPGASRAEICVWTPDLRAKRSPGSDLIRAAPGEDQLYSKEKETLMRAKGNVSRLTRGKKPLFLRTARLARAAFGRETASKRQRRV